MTSAILDTEEVMGEVVDGWQRYQRANADRIAAALDTGAALIDLRERLGHGEFLPAIRRLGIPERTAQNWMRLARAGLKNETVADLGGIRAALEHLRKTAKTGDEIRAIELDADNAGLRRQLGCKLLDTTPDTLARYATLVRVQGELREQRHEINRLVTENDSIRRQIEMRQAEIDRLQAEIDQRRN